jgi:Flp pilus assembly pilin Flp
MEYALIAFLIAVVIIFAVTVIGTGMGTLFNRIADCVQNATNGGAC